MTADRPNVIIVMSDQMKATASHLYGSTFCQTPSMERLAASGVLFRNAVTPHPLCVPARISFWTSQYPHTHGGRRNQTLMPAGANHAFRVWKGAGYHTGLIGKNHCFEQDEDLALFDTWCEIGHNGLAEGAETKGMAWVRPVEAIDEAHSVRRNMPEVSPRFSCAVTDFPLEDYSSGLVAAQTERFLETHGCDEPFALWVSFPDPHEPWECPRHYADMFPPEKIDMPPFREDEFSDGTAPERNRVLYEMLGMEDDEPEHVQRLMACYYGMTRFVDDGLGRILDAVEANGLRENTIVVFCADHGDLMGEHRMARKGGVFYDALTRVPLIVAWPGQVAPGQIDEGMANLLDIVPTVFRLQGLDVPRQMQGNPLPTVTDAEPRDAAFSEYGAGGPSFTMENLLEARESGRRALFQSLQWREAEGRRKMVRTTQWKLVHDPMGDLDELYDLVKDPWELTNLAGNSEYDGLKGDMMGKLADWSINTEDAVPVPLP